MTINQCITKIKAIKPNTYDDTTIVGWLSELEQTIFEETMSWHDDAPEHKPLPYDPMDDMDTELFVEEPYSDIYTKYVIAQMDYHNGETMRYANSASMYNTAMERWKNYFNRNHMPKQENIITI